MHKPARNVAPAVVWSGSSLVPASCHVHGIHGAHDSRCGCALHTFRRRAGVAVACNHGLTFSFNNLESQPSSFLWERVWGVPVDPARLGWEAQVRICHRGERHSGRTPEVCRPCQCLKHRIWRDWSCFR